MTALSIRDRYEMDNKGTVHQFVWDLSFGSVDKSDIIQTN